MRVINIICDRIWIVRGLAAILEAALKSDCAWIPPCSFMPYHSSCNLIPIHFGHCCVLYWKPYQADLDQPIWIFVILSTWLILTWSGYLPGTVLGILNGLILHLITRLPLLKQNSSILVCSGGTCSCYMHKSEGGIKRKRLTTFGCLPVRSLPMMSQPLWYTVQVYFRGNSVLVDPP